MALLIACPVTFPRLTALMLLHLMYGSALYCIGLLLDQLKRLRVRIGDADVPAFLSCRWTGNVCAQGLTVA